MIAGLAYRVLVPNYVDMDNLPSNGNEGDIQYSPIVLLHPDSSQLEDDVLQAKWDEFYSTPTELVYGEEMDQFLTWICSRGYYMPNNECHGIWIVPIDNDEDEEEEDGEGG